MKKSIAVLVPVLILIAAGILAWNYYEDSNEDVDNQEAAVEKQEPELTLPEKFVQAWVDIELPGVEPITEPHEITGHEEADARIRDLAEERGYRLQSLPTADLTDLQGVTMQHEVAVAWEQLQNSAREEGIYLGLVSGFRSVENQRVIFLTQLQDRGIAEQDRAYTSSQIVAGEADAVVNAILREYSPPGYSKHHTGYAIDITDTASDKPFEEFDQTKGFEWVSQNDFSNIRRFGFLPSYPEGGPAQGPQPEPWEYVWVGQAVAEGL